MQTLFIFEKGDILSFIIFPLPYIFKDISKSIYHTEMVQLSTNTSMYNVPRTLDLFNISKNIAELCEFHRIKKRPV